MLTKHGFEPSEQAFKKLTLEDDEEDNDKALAQNTGALELKASLHKEVQDKRQDRILIYLRS